MHLRHQLAAYSPITLRSIAASFGAAVSGSTSPIDHLAALLRERYSGDGVLLVDSGTHALEIAIRAAVAHTKTTAPVALPAFACYDVATAAVGAGVRVAMYDIDPHTLGPDFDSLRRVLVGGSRVIVAAHLYGVPIDWQSLETLAQEFDAFIIEDAAQGHGASWRGRPLGCLAPISVLSFSRGKGWTGGKGGAVMMRSGIPRNPLPEIPSSRRSSEFANSMALGAQWTLGRPSVYGVPRSVPALALGETTYKEPSPVGAIPAGAAAALLASDTQAGAEAEWRRRSGAAWTEALADVAGLSLTCVPAGGTAGFLRFPVRGVDPRSPEWPRAERLGAAASYPRALAELPALAGRLATADAMPGAAELAANLTTLPTHSRVTAHDISQLVRLLRSRA